MIKVKGQYKYEIWGIDGKVRDSGVINNTITNTGIAELANLAGNVSSPASFTYLAVGTNSTAVSASQTALVAEITDTGLARASATASRTTTTVTNDTLNLVYEWTATGSKTIEEMGVFNAASSGTMLSRVLTGTKSLTNGEKYSLTYTLTLASA